ncbi:MAG: hypothetical protein M1827_006992 [Pycnora praestabilis]|nr:MAG: hypothetical protein M1827_006992 [Pycnora praestabilis]
MEGGDAIASRAFLQSIFRRRTEERTMDAGKPQPKRCNFFLWDDEAKPREEAAVLNNSRSEPRSTPQTPDQNARGAYLRSPSRTASPSPSQSFVTTPSKASSLEGAKPQNGQEEEDFFDWPLSGDEEIQLSAAVDQASTNEPATASSLMPPPETPRKVARTEEYITPDKRRRSPSENGDGADWPTPATNDPFTTPPTVMTGRNLFPKSSNAGLLDTPSGTDGMGMLSPTSTPTPSRFKDAAQGIGEDLVMEVFDALREMDAVLNDKAKSSLKQILKKQTLKAQGIAKGRDISRLAIKSKDLKIAELQTRIASLEAERETDKAVIRHLRNDKKSLHIR